MNGAESLIRTLQGAGVDTCFSNPGTSEMHFVGAFDRVDGMRCVLTLFDGAAVGAADGYARMTDRPALALLHLGGGLANGLSNLHNAQKSRTPVLTVVGDHASYLMREHGEDVPSGMDVAAAARAYSDRVGVATSGATLGADVAAALAAARSRATPVSTLVVPADMSWAEDTQPAPPVEPEAPVRTPDADIEAIARVLRSGESAVLCMTGPVLRDGPMKLADRIAQATGCRAITRPHNARIERGAGRVALDRQPYPIDAARAAYRGVRHIVLVGATPPVANFAYPGKPSVLWEDGCTVHTLASPQGDSVDALERLAQALDLGDTAPRLAQLELPPLPTGALDPAKIALSLAALLPEQAIVIDESVTVGRNFYNATVNARPHDWIQNVGGAIGIGPSLATGCAVACPDRKVLALEGDGCMMYMPQTLWTQAREGLDVTTVVFNNRAYAILKLELANVGAANPGPRALHLTELNKPDIDFVGMARSFGVPGVRVGTCEELNAALAAAMADPGPHLIEVSL